MAFWRGRDRTRRVARSNRRQNEEFARRSCDVISNFYSFTAASQCCLWTSNTVRVFGALKAQLSLARAETESEQDWIEV